VEGTFDRGGLLEGTKPGVLEEIYVNLCSVEMWKARLIEGGTRRY